MVYLLELKTTKSSTIKTLVEILQSLFNEVNFSFSPNSVKENGEKEHGGLLIREINKYKSLLVYTKLKADMFESFEYNSTAENINIGINLGYLSKCLKCMANYDSLTMAIDEEEKDTLIISLENEKDKKVIKLNLMDLEFKPFKVENIVPAYKCIINSTLFHKYCKDLIQVSDKMEIKCNKNKLCLAGKGEVGVIDYEVLPSENGLEILRDDDEPSDSIVQGLFELRYLTIFTKCSTFSNKVELYLQNDYPIVLEYNVDGLGEIRFVLSNSSHDNSYDMT